MQRSHPLLSEFAGPAGPQRVLEPVPVAMGVRAHTHTPLTQLEASLESLIKVKCLSLDREGITEENPLRR